MLITHLILSLAQSFKSPRRNRSTSKRVSQGRQQLPFAFDFRLNQTLEKWNQVAVAFRRANGISDGD
ncbi:hypothetical protein PMIT1323_02210 [Prochlorococcus marinus str. MIT 1323]|nr:hypothetical protein PMIT1323_02210 [Prochlorococcus marinus str. MIT 1323]